MKGDRFKKRFGKRIKFLRGLENMTQAVLAEKTEISLVYLNKIERGLASPSFAVIAQLARSLGTEPANLFLFSEGEGLSGPASARSRMQEPTMGWAKYISGIGFWDLDLQGGDMFWSDSLYKVFGFSAKSVAPSVELFRKHVHAQDRDQVDGAWAASGNVNAFSVLEFRIVRSDGTVRHLVGQSQLERNDKGEPSRVFGTVMDVTERKRLEQEFRRTRQTLAQRVKDRTGELSRTVRRLESEAADRKRFQQELRENEERYQDLYDNAPDMYASIKPEDGTIIQCNETMARILGRAKNDILERSVFDFIHPDRLDAAKKILRVFATAGEVRNAELQMVDREGEAIEVIANLSAVRGDEGEILYSRTSMRDITERKRAQEAMEQSEEMYRNLVDNAHEGILVVEENKLLFANSRAAEIVGHSFDVMFTRPFLELCHPDDQDKIIKNSYLRAKGLELPSTYDFRVIDAEGKVRWVEVAGTRIKWKGEDATLAFLSDVTEKKMLEQLREDVERIARHDLKVPATATITAAKMFLDADNLTDRQKRVASELELLGYRMMNMINLSLDIYKMETGTYEFNPLPVDMLPLAQSVILDMPDGKPGYAEPDLFFNGSKVCSGDSCMVMGDELLCRTMLANLMKNAMEAAPSGSTVRLNIETKGRQARINLHNEGAVPREIGETFFDKYVTSGKRNGVGLGAYSARLFAEAQGGSISAASSEEDGTTVTVVLPLQK